MFKYLFFLFFTLINISAWSCENSLSIQENITSDLCSLKDIFVSPNVQSTENVKIEVHGKIFGKITNTKNIILKTYVSDNIQNFSNPENVHALGSAM